MFKVKHLFLNSILFLLAFSLLACQVMVQGSKSRGHYEFKRSLTSLGYWEVMIEDDVQTLYNAVLAGVKELGLQVASSKIDRFSGAVEGTYPDNTTFTVKLSYKSPELTRMMVRVGSLRNKNQAVQLFQAIEKQF
jgi:hypothetical protein